MFVLKRRIPSYSNEDNGDLNRTIVFDEVKNINGPTCTTPSPKRKRTDRPPSPLSQYSPKGSLNGNSKPQSKVRFVRGLSRNQKTRISIYLQLLNMFVTALVAAKDKALLLFEIVRTKGLSENMHLAASVFITAIFLSLSLALYALVLTHQSLVWMCSDYLLLNVSFFTINPSTSETKSAPAAKLKDSEESQATESSRTLLSSASKPLWIEPRPLIDISAESCEPVPEVLAPKVLSPIQLELRSLSPAFDASANAQAKRAEIESIEASLASVDTHTHPAVNNFPATRSRVSPPMKDILSSRAAFSPMMSFPARPDRSMSTVSYPDTNGPVSSDEEDTRNAIRSKSKLSQVIDESEEEPESSPQDASNEGGLLYLNEEDEEDSVPEADVDIPFTSSPAPEKVELAATEIIPVAQPVEIAPIKVQEAPVPRQSTPPSRSRSIHTPPSRVTTVQAVPAPVDAQDPESVLSPRDIFSPTPQSMHSLPFAIPFLREQLQQTLPGANSSSTSSAEATSVVEAEAEAKKADGEKKDNIGEPTPYPSPPFTPPGSRPPTMYASMNELTVDPTPDPFVVEKSQLSAVVEDAKAEIERSLSPPAQPAQEAVISEPATSQPQAIVEVEPETTADVEVAIPAPVEEEQPAPVVETPAPVEEVKEPVPEVVEEIKMPAPARGILRSRSSSVSSSQLNVAPSPRAASPVKSIGRGGMTNGSRVDVEDCSHYSPAPVASVAPAVPAVENVAQEKTQEAQANKDDEDEVVNGAGSGADDESTAPKGKVDMKKKKKRTKKPKAKRGVSFDEQPTLIDTSMDEDIKSGDESASASMIASPSTSTHPAASILAGLASANTSTTNGNANYNPSKLSSSIPVPKTFEIEDEEEEPIPTLVSPAVSLEAFRGSPVPMATPRRASIISEAMAMSPRSTADELSDSSSTWPAGEFSPKQVDHYARWFARAHRDKSLPTVGLLRQQMKDCSDSELAMRLKLGSRSESTKLTKTLMGEDKSGNSSSGSVPSAVRRNSSYRRRR